MQHGENMHHLIIGTIKKNNSTNLFYFFVCVEAFLENNFCQNVVTASLSLLLLVEKFAIDCYTFKFSHSINFLLLYFLK